MLRRRRWPRSSTPWGRHRSSTLNGTSSALVVVAEYNHIRHPKVDLEWASRRALCSAPATTRSEWRSGTGAVARPIRRIHAIHSAESQGTDSLVEPADADGIIANSGIAIARTLNVRSTAQGAIRRGRVERAVRCPMLLVIRGSPTLVVTGGLSQPAVEPWVPRSSRCMADLLTAIPRDSFRRRSESA